MTSAEIVHELRGARPAAPPLLRARVEAIAASTPAPRPSFAARLLPRRRGLLVALPAAAMLAVASAGVIGVVRSDGPSGTVAARDTTTEAAQSKAAPETAFSGAADASTGTTPGPTAGRAQRVSASLTIEVDDTDALSQATQEALQTTRSLGGYVVSVNYATGTDGTASLTLRVPTAKVQDAITRLSSLGTIVAQQVQIDDLQESIDALDKRITGLRERIATITARLEDEPLGKETRAVLEARRTAARAELARLRGERAGQAAEARLATIQLALQTDTASAAPATPSRFDRTLDDMVEVLAIEGLVALFALVIVGPFVLIGLAAWWGRRALRHREDERLLSAS
jgi:uncharacterized protein DUF4349